VYDSPGSILTWSETATNPEFLVGHIVDLELPDIDRKRGARFARHAAAICVENPDKSINGQLPEHHSYVVIKKERDVNAVFRQIREERQTLERAERTTGL